MAFQSTNRGRMERGLWRNKIVEAVKEDEAIEYFGEESSNSAEAPIGGIRSLSVS